MRGTFGNIRLRNRLVEGKEGPYTVHLPSNEEAFIYDAAMRYRSEGRPAARPGRAGVRLRVVARLGGQGPGAARRPRRACRVVRADPPLEPRRDGRVAAPVQAGRHGGIARPRWSRDLLDHGHRRSAVTPAVGDGRGGSATTVDRCRFEAIARLDGPIEVDYYRGGGILPAVLRRLASERLRAFVDEAANEALGGGPRASSRRRTVAFDGVTRRCSERVTASIRCALAVGATLPERDPDRPHDPTYIPGPDDGDDAGHVVHLGRQHAVPARCRAVEHRGICRQRVLRDRPGAVRGADRCRRGHARPTLLVPARRGDAARVHRPLPASCGRSTPRSSAGPWHRPCSDSGSRSSPGPPRRGSSTRWARPASRDSSRPSSGGPRPRPGRAMLVGSVLGGRRRPGDRPRCAVHPSGGDARA